MNATVGTANGTDALARVVAAARQMEEHEEVDRWEFSDDVAEAVDALGQNGFDQRAKKGSGDTGFFRAIDQVNDEIAKAGVLTVGRQSIVGAYTIAKAWPREDRVDGATYWAHYELRARDYHGRRQAILTKLVRKSRTGRVGPREVRLWKSDSRPVDITPRDERLEKALRATLRRWASPQKFSQLHQDERGSASRLLYRLAREIETGEFE